MKIKTKDLKAMVSKVQKGSVPNGIIPITGLININKGDGTFSLRTFDGYCHYRATSSDGVQGDDSFSVSVNSNLFVNLVAKTTSEEVALWFDGKSLSFKGNGSYKLEVVFDGGTPLDFPPLDGYFDGVGETHSLNLKELSKAFSSCEVSMAKNVADYPMYSAMFISDKCVSTDNNTACLHDGKVIDEGSALIPYPALRFLGSFGDSEEITLGITDGNDPTFHLSDPTFCVCGPLAPKHRSFPAAKLESMVSVPVNRVAVDVAEALGAIERVILFSKQYDEQGVYVSFHDGAIDVACIQKERKTDAVSEEIVAYEVGDDGKPTDSVACVSESLEAPLNVYYLQSQLRAIKSDKAVIGFGSKTFITIAGGDDLYMLSFLRLGKAR